MSTSIADERWLLANEKMNPLPQPLPGPGGYEA